MSLNLQWLKISASQKSVDHLPRQKNVQKITFQKLNCYRKPRKPPKTSNPRCLVEVQRDKTCLTRKTSIFKVEAWEEEQIQWFWWFWANMYIYIFICLYIYIYSFIYLNSRYRHTWSDGVYIYTVYTYIYWNLLFHKKPMWFIQDIPIYFRLFYDRLYRIIANKFGPPRK